MDNLFIVIPTRLNSKRLPNKVLKKINGKTLMQHVWESLKDFPNVYIATDNHQIIKEANKLQANVILTTEKPINGTERCNELAEKLKLNPKDILINVQCDELNIKREWIKKIYMELSNSKSEIIVTVSTNLGKQTTQFWEKYNQDLSNVQVFLDENNFAKNFKRSSSKIFESFNFYNHHQKKKLKINHHIGIYGYKVGTLSKISKLKITDREKTEKLEQIRWFENNYKIKSITTKDIHFGFSINTKEDLERLKKQNIL